jgi:pyruvate dehydrogenase E1 component beta subunit
MITKKTIFTDVIRETLSQELSSDDSLIVMGLGVNDPKGVFGTTLGLVERFGTHRVFETPTSENAMLGIAVGLAIKGHRVVLVHQRLDFFLLAFDQLINAATKWNFMFGGQTPIPITIRLILGRGWGQGPTHSQNLHALFAHLPGIKVVMPAFARDAGPLLSSSIRSDSPVIFLEDRWLHFQEQGEILESSISIGRHSVVRNGSDCTVIASGFMTIEAMRTASALEELGVSIHVVDLRTLKPLDVPFLVREVEKTGKAVIADSGPSFANFGKEIAYQINRAMFGGLEHWPIVVSGRDAHEPTSHGVIGEFKVSASDIAIAVFSALNREPDVKVLQKLKLEKWDVPNEEFTGPF